MVAKKQLDDEPQTLNNSTNNESKSHKKHKRKLEDQEPEIVVESKKEKKKKKKKQEQEGFNGKIETLCGSNGNTEIIDGSVELSEKKKKKKEKKQKQEQENGFNGKIETLSGSNGNTETFGGLVELSNGEVVKESSSTNVVVTGKGANELKYKALVKFVDSGLPSEVLECCKNFEKPSPIQSHSWPFLLDGRDFIGIARTGSGKTLAFGIPAIMHIMGKRKSKKSKNPVCLVLSPTRELAQQIADVLCEAGKPTGVQSVCLYGGVDKHHQKASLRSGVDIVIGTPGRLQDLMEMGVCNLKEVSFVVLDEADRMLDLGFEPAVRAILSQTCSVRQSVMFSATWPAAVHQLAQEFMDPNPIKVVVGSEDLAANHDVMQIVEVLEDRARDERLQCLLEKYHKSRRNRVLVFVLYKKEASRVEMMLQKRGWKVVSISGDKQQHARTKALSLFKDGSCPLMIATDVAARGLDIPDVEVVINYSFPLTTEDYVHRIGRTGRAGKKGVAHTFFTKDNKGLSGELINVLREAGQNVPAALLNFGTHVKKKESKLYGAHFREIDANAPKATKIKFGDSDNED
ncbi:DEAD-box ATP-dependent RNA helicase 5 isoform X2 [Lycium barbarum]|uniref:DEAD-box ATP-dependent RNA helicase 5 isoform X2 n=1 Tax=Lycium barbarum TaxID=112863 RepID=UPI00293E26CD|nr:DEAD-box ATP-dependent RNA helicase 5 isoform X2 [Lycium barbarum]